MSDPSIVILYVENPTVSASFYADLLGKTPVEASDSFAMFALECGMMLALWSRHTVMPAATGTGGGELMFPCRDVAALAALHADWAARGIAMLHPPVHAEFGDSFTAVDPDGHRLRVLVPAG